MPITKKKIEGVDEMLPIKEISFDLEPLRDKKKAALITISSGCNNFCSYCIVPYSRGKEISRKMNDILKEHKDYEPYSLDCGKIKRALKEPNNQLTLMPHINNTDGFFIAAFKRIR